MLTVYDWHGNYGHPDHIKVHHVGHRAAELAGTERVAEATMNRDHGRAAWSRWRAKQGCSWARTTTTSTSTAPPTTATRWARQKHEITLAVDVSPFVWLKRDAVKAHRSQVTDTSFFAEMPDEMFAASFGTEWFIESGVEQEGGPRRGWFFE